MTVSISFLILNEAAVLVRKLDLDDDRNGRVEWSNV